MKRHKPPAELASLSKRIFDAIKVGSLKKLCPGEIYLKKKLPGSLSKWTFKFEICETPGPFVCIFVREDSFGDRLNLEEIRRQLGLTRGETDVIRKMLSGLKTAEIGEDLNISKHAVKECISNVYAKCRVKNKFELFSFILNFPE